MPPEVTIQKYLVGLLSPRGYANEYEGIYDEINEKVIYNSENNIFLKPAGKWQVKLILETDDGRRIPGSISSFTVLEDWNSSQGILIK